MTHEARLLGAIESPDTICTRWVNDLIPLLPALGASAWSQRFGPFLPLAAAFLTGILIPVGLVHYRDWWQRIRDKTVCASKVHRVLSRLHRHLRTASTELRNKRARELGPLVAWEPLDAALRVVTNDFAAIRPEMYALSEPDVEQDVDLLVSKCTKRLLILLANVDSYDSAERSWSGNADGAESALASLASSVDELAASVETRVRIMERRTHWITSDQ